MQFIKTFDLVVGNLTSPPTGLPGQHTIYSIRTYNICMFKWKMEKHGDMAMIEVALP